MNETFQRQYAECYDLLYRDKNYAGEARYIAQLLRGQQLSKEIDSILDVGCGTGRHGRELASMGFQVLGVDHSRHMILIANRNRGNGAGFLCADGDISELPADSKFDAAIAAFHVASYQFRPYQLTRFIASISERLTSGGLFWFDVWHADAVLACPPTVRIKRVANEQVVVTRIAEPSFNFSLSRQVDVIYTLVVENKTHDGHVESVAIARETHRMRPYGQQEIESAASAGFQVVACEEPVTRRPPSCETWSVGYLLRKK